MAGNIATAFAYVADVTTPETRARGMGVVGAAFGLGFVAGPAIGGLLAGPDPAHADFQTPALAAAALSALAFVLTWFRLPESLSPGARAARANAPGGFARPWLDALRRPRLRGMIGLMFLATFVFAGMESTFAIWSRRQFGWGPEQNGYLFAFVGLLIAAIQGIAIGRLATRFGERRLVTAGAILLAVGLGAVPFAFQVPALVLAMTLAGIGFSLVTPALNSLISLEAAEGERGGIMGMARSSTTLARVLGPALAGAVFGLIGKDAPYIGGAILMVLLAWLVPRVLKLGP
jgi:DHA1 family tetracycline resistance protein-like MFS transporter